MIHFGKHHLNPAQVIGVVEDHDRMIVTTTQIVMDGTSQQLTFTGDDAKKVQRWLELTEDKV